MSCDYHCRNEAWHLMQRWCNTSRPQLTSVDLCGWVTSLRDSRPTQHGAWISWACQRSYPQHALYTTLFICHETYPHIRPCRLPAKCRHGPLGKEVRLDIYPCNDLASAFQLWGLTPDGHGRGYYIGVQGGFIDHEGTVYPSVSQWCLFIGSDWLVLS